MPLDEWMRGPFGGFVEQSLFNSSLRRRRLFDYGFVKQLMTEHREGHENYSFFLWCLLNLSLWYDNWIEGDAISQKAAAVDMTLRI